MKPIHTTCNSHNLAPCNRPSQTLSWLSQTTSYPQVHSSNHEFAFLARPSPHHVEVHTHLLAMQAHTDRRRLNATHFSQSTPTFYPMHSVYPVPLTYPSLLKPFLYHLCQLKIYDLNPKNLLLKLEIISCNKHKI